MLEAAVGAPVEPVGVFAQPRMIRRALNRKVQCDLHAVLTRRLDQYSKILQGAQLGVYGFVPTLFGANGVRAARIIRACLQAVVATLAVLPADGVNGRKVQNVETHATNFRQSLHDVEQRAVAPGLPTLRAGKELIPAREHRFVAL